MDRLCNGVLRQFGEYEPIIRGTDVFEFFLVNERPKSAPNRSSRMWLASLLKRAYHVRCRPRLFLLSCSRHSSEASALAIRLGGAV